MSQRLAQRGELFLVMARDGIFARPERPYARLFSIAGCTYGDLERLVRSEGLDAALATLYMRGVYLTVDEMKGRVAVRRGSASFDLRPQELRNPLVGGDLRLYTGGSRGPRTTVPVVLDFLIDRAADQLVEYEARGGLGWRHAIWTVPGGMPLAWILWHAGAGLPVARWFTQIDPRIARLPGRYRWVERVLQLGGLLAGVELPKPAPASIEDPLPVARWMAACLDRGEVPHLWSFPSATLRLCRAAAAAGLDLSGAQFTVSGEPLTEARASVIRQAGGRVTTVYGTAETYAIALSCLNPQAADDMHVLDDLVALIQPGQSDLVAKLQPRTLLVTTLRPTAPMLLVNASLGDQGTLFERACDCPLSRIGWRRHLSGVRSSEKLTAGGVTFLDADVAAVLDAELPTRFGGGPSDYQLIEEEGSEGQPRLVLAVDPAVGPLAERDVIDTFLAALARIGDAERVAQVYWRHGGWLEIRRERPRATAAGKILHVRSTSARSGRG
ncbi:MAG: hypothetical protein QN120_03260 [Armatimonadota bacterium]|nr:hypothetical protein [Armatimonadota bacterium]